MHSLQFIFFFYGFNDHRDLLSFPTRRSSDLGGSGRAADRLPDPSREATSPVFTKDPDRKSTRLNSSHGYISYAVFCLKKKNKKKDRQTVIMNKQRNQSQQKKI